MKDDSLIRIIKALRADSYGLDGGELVQERADAMDHYHGRPYGDEMEGRSQVVSRDLAEAVDWAMPAIIRPFIQSGNVVEFTPTTEQDQASAEQESDYVNYVIMKDNDGFMILHDCFKDALLLKNCYVKHWWDESETVRDVEYNGLTLIQLAKILYDLKSEGAEVEIKEQQEVATAQGMTFEVKLSIKRKKNKICIEPIPPEELRIHKRTRGSVQGTPFIEHVTTKTRSELLEMGLPKDWVAKLEPSSQNNADNRQRMARDSVSDENDDESENLDKSLDEFDYCEAYLKVDYDGDGLAELRKVVTVNSKIPPGDEWNEAIDCIPITGGVPKRIPHRHIGESLDDDLQDLQRIKTVLTRQMLDNVYNTNNQQWIINERVDEESFLMSLPGGLKKVADDLPVEGAVMPVPTTPILNQILPAIDYFDGVKGSRTGITKESTQMDPDVLKQATKGAFLEGLNRASQKVEMITRMLAETFVKELCLRVHELILKHQDSMRSIKLNGKFVEVDPRLWKERQDMTVKVGLGTGSSEERLQKLTLLSSLQEKLVQADLVSPQNAYNMFDDIAKALGVVGADRYAMEPGSEQYQQFQASKPPQQNPLAEIEHIKGQYQLQAQQLKAHMDAQVQQLQMQMDAEKNAAEIRNKEQLDLLRAHLQQSQAAADRASREAIAAAQMETQAFLKGLHLDLGQPGIGAGLQDGE